MRGRQLFFLIGLICLVSCWMFLEPGSRHLLAHAQQSTPAAASDPQVFRTESRLVLVDTVVTDKKGNYIRDLAQKDFKVWEDGKEQTITSFSFEEKHGLTDCTATLPRSVLRQLYHGLWRSGQSQGCSRKVY